jgi:hypothetical protein
MASLLMFFIVHGWETNTGERTEGNKSTKGTKERKKGVRDEDTK